MEDGCKKKRKHIQPNESSSVQVNEKEISLWNDINTESKLLLLIRSCTSSILKLGSPSKISTFITNSAAVLIPQKCLYLIGSVVSAIEYDREDSFLFLPAMDMVAIAKSQNPECVKILLSTITVSLKTIIKPTPLCNIPLIYTHLGLHALKDTAQQVDLGDPLMVLKDESLVINGYLNITTWLFKPHDTRMFKEGLKIQLQFYYCEEHDTVEIKLPLTKIKDEQFETVKLDHLLDHCNLNSFLSEDDVKFRMHKVLNDLFNNRGACFPIKI